MIERIQKKATAGFLIALAAIVIGGLALAIASIPSASGGQTVAPLVVPTTIPAGSYVPAPAPAAVTQPPTSNLQLQTSRWVGLNLTGIGSTNRECPFVDWTKSGRKWGSFAKTYDQSAMVDARGWPTTSAGTIWTNCQDVNGVYQLSCPGRVSFTAFQASVSKTVYDPIKNLSSATLTINQPAGKTFDLAMAVDSGGKPWSGLKITAPFPASADGLFNQTWVNSLDPSLTVLRFMDWLDTNDSTIAHWSERPQISDAQWSIHGVPYEICIALGNLTGKDIWLNIPALADDDYIRQLGRLVAGQGGIKPGLHCYIEYSNEVWNGIFAQYKQNAQATAAAIAGGDKALPDPSSPSNVVYAQWRNVAKQSIRARRLLDESDPQRQIFRVVLPIQVNGDLSMLPRMLDWIRSNAGEPSAFLYAVCGAPYFSEGKTLAANASATPDQLLAGFAANTPLAAASAGMVANCTLAHANGLKFICYEAGEDNLQDPANQTNKLLAQADPRQAGIVSGFLSCLFTRGDVDGACWFSDANAWDKFNAFGLRQHFADTNAPKYVGVIGFARGLAAAGGAQ